jgi:hypothetical protein
VALNYDEQKIISMTCELSVHPHGKMKMAVNCLNRLCTMLQIMAHIFLQGILQSSPTPPLALCTSDCIDNIMEGTHVTQRHNS